MPVEYLLFMPGMWLERRKAFYAGWLRDRARKIREEA